ncbi:hypothetical protein [Streptacidiphilus jiangxiensis]|uniref:Uncharacterized protein n=1 Tax=Streptacidiphilus jiangxiensis TaxID=235985 RepID=A0A1H8B4I5_STRJI|nr:hypothetical protein [Streptacidiphilus jiangxiensis]SEM77845.1 hypothetical protein SAMN05414137_15714 [Streptacidiphilus jiangxiensis]
MDLEQYAALTATPLGRSRLSAADLGGPDRTIAFGFTAERHAWHLYLEGDLLHVLTYDGRAGQTVHHQQSQVWLTANLVPSKRLYPESTDAQFARLMRSRGHDLRFRDFDAQRHARRRDRAFHGLVLDRRSGALVERIDPAAPGLTAAPVHAGFDLVLDRAPDGPTEATLYRDGVEIPGVRVHTVDPGASGHGHGWLRQVTDLPRTVPATVNAHVALLAHTYHGVCDTSCQQDSDPCR